MRRTPFLPPVLVTESADEQAELYDALRTETMALGTIDEIYVGTVLSASLEIERYERCKAAIIDVSYRQVLQEVMRPVGAPEQQLSDCVPEKKLEALTCQGSTDEKTRLSLEVRERLGQLQLNDSYIMAEAIRRCLKDVELFDRMIGSLELRRNRALRTMVEWREAWGRQLRASTAQVMDGKIAHALDRHPELELQVYEAIRKDADQLRWSFPPKPEKAR